MARLSVLVACALGVASPGWTQARAPSSEPSAAAPAPNSPEETEVAARLSAQGESFLASLLGPGHARLLITVEGERSNTQTETQIFTPINVPSSKTERQQRPTASPGGPMELPGYARDYGLSFGMPGYEEVLVRKDKDNYVQMDQERTQRLGGFIIKKLKVSCVLDSRLSDAQVATVAKLLPDLLHIDTSRGDELAMLRADMLPVWRSTIQSPEGVRATLLVVAAALLVLFVGLVFYYAAARLVRLFVGEVARHRALREEPGPAALSGGSELPELMPGGAPALLDQEPGEGRAGETGALALGRRFDFLAEKDTPEIVRLLGEETPQDLALLFGYLTGANPEVAANIFAALPAGRQAAVSQALVSLTMADPERLAMLETRMRNLVEFGVQGTDRLGKILSRLPVNERDAVLNTLSTSNPQAAEEISRSLFTFEDIARLKPNELRRLIMAATYPDWGLALRGAPPELVDRILEQLLPGTQNVIREAMDTPQPRPKVLEARSRILSQAYELAARGEVVLSKEGAPSDLV